MAHPLHGRQTQRCFKAIPTPASNKLIRLQEEQKQQRAALLDAVRDSRGDTNTVHLPNNVAESPEFALLEKKDVTVAATPAPARSASRLLIHPKAKPAELRMLCNSAATEIVIDGKTYATVQHFVDSRKFLSTCPTFADRFHRESKHYIGDKAQLSEAVASSKYRTGSELDYCGVPVARPPEAAVDRHWDGTKLRVMMQALKAKMVQHPVVRRTLLATNNDTLLYHCQSDPYWGTSTSRSGQNQMGLLLMKLRGALRYNYEPKVFV